MASILWQDLLQALAMMSMIFAFREVAVLWGLLLTSLSQTH
jgi:hypothetical protein